MSNLRCGTQKHYALNANTNTLLILNEKALISIIALAMFVLTLIKGDKRTVWLTSLLTIGLLAAWINESKIKSIAWGVYLLASLLIALNALRKNDMSRILRISVFITGVWTLGVNLFAYMQWSYASEMKISLLIPITLYIVNISKGLIKRKEFGYMTILNSLFLLRLF